MAVKLPDTLVPMADFPSAFAKDVQFTDGENLQDKLDKGKLGSSSSGTGLTEEQANNIEKIPSIEGIVTSNSQAIENKADKDHEHTEYLKEIPDEYVTDTELSTELDKKVDKEVDKGLSTNDLTNELVIKINSSATEAFVTNAIANAQLGDKEVDLSGYATVDALNLKADLTHTHDQYLTEVPDEYITETELTDKNYADKEYVTQAVSNVNVDLTEYAKTSDIPTKVSQLTNDSNFITTIPEEYITETELANELSTRNVKTYTNITQLGLTAPVITGRIYNALPENSIFQCEITDNKTVSDTPENTGILTIQKSSKRLAIEFKACARYSVFPNNLYLGQLKGDDGSGITWNKVALSSDLEGCVTDTELSSKGYATETFVTDKIAEASLSGSGVDLSGYATKDDVPTKTSELTNDSGFINTIPAEYITETELNAKGYLTSHQDISGLQPKTDNNLATTSKEVVGAINEVKDMADLILDTEVRLNKTYSSSKIHSDIQDAIDSSKSFTLAEIGKMSSASYKVVTSTTEMTSKSIIYLLPNATNYDMYIVEADGTATKIGNMDIDLSQYYTKQEITDNYYDKATSDGKFATITTVDNHTGDTDIHITNAERTKWNDTAYKVNGEDLVKKADIVTTTLDENATNDDIYGGKAIYDAIKANYVGKETMLFKGAINTTGTYTLADDVNIYDFIVINHCDEDNLKQSVVLTKNEINTCIDTNSSFTCVKAKGSTNLEINGYFNRDKIVISKCLRQNITSIIGYKFGQITVANTITNPTVGKSYSLDEQLTGGTWIDGKPIYRKTVNCGQLPNTDGKDTPHGIANIDKVIDTYGVAFDSGGINVSLPFADASSDGSISAYRNGAIIRITTAKDRTSFTETYITIEYTKTTD